MNAPINHLQRHLSTVELLAWGGGKDWSKDPEPWSLHHHRTHIYTAERDRGHPCPGLHRNACSHEGTPKAWPPAWHATWECINLEQIPAAQWELLDVRQSSGWIKDVMHWIWVLAGCCQWVGLHMMCPVLPRSPSPSGWGVVYMHNYILSTVRRWATS